MADKLDEIIKNLVLDGRRKGFLTYTEMNKILEDQFIPPDRMDQVFMALEDNGIDVVDEADAAPGLREPSAEAKSGTKQPAAAAAPAAVKTGLAEKIDDPVRMYLTQMGEIPLLTRPNRRSTWRRRSRSRASASARSAWAPACA